MSARLTSPTIDPGIEPPSRPPESPQDDDDDGRGDDLVRVAIAAHQSEAEFLPQLLAEEGIPSVIQRSRGFDVPEFLAAGPRDVLVRRREELDAREALLQTGRPGEPPIFQAPDPLKLLGALLFAVAVGALVLWLGFR